MKKMQRILALLLTLTLVLSFLGCGKKNSAVPSLPAGTTAPTDPSTPADPTKPSENDTEKDDNEEDSKEDNEEDSEEDNKEDEEDDKPSSGIAFADLAGTWVAELDVAELVKADLIASTPEDEEEIEGVFELIDTEDLTINWYWEFDGLLEYCTTSYDEDEFAELVEIFAERYFEALYEYYEDEIDETYDEYYEANFEDTYSGVADYFDWDWPYATESFSVKCEDGEVFFDASADEWISVDVSRKDESLTVKSMDTEVLSMSDTLCQVMFPLKLTAE